MAFSDCVDYTECVSSDICEQLLELVRHREA
jgi:hypothetical protein